MKPAIVVFDLGKVLLDFDYARAATRLAAQSNTSLNRIQSFLDQSPLLFRYETGLLNRQEFHAAVCAGTGYRGSLGEFAVCFGDIFTEICEMTRVQAELQAAGIPTYIFSNTNDLAVEHVRATYPFFAKFDGYIFSYEVGSMKPAGTIYAALERLTGKRGAEIVYLDDRAENVRAGIERGWRTILHSDPAASRAELRRLGLPV